MIELHDVSKTYWASGAPRPILRNLTMKIPRGRNLGLLGRNGAGKSTFMRLISGAAKPDSGIIERRCRVSWPLGFSGSFHKALSGAQNIRFVARAYGVDPDLLIDYVEDFAELGPYLHESVGVYSSGMKARLAFGVSMGVEFDLYLVDEVTAVGDETFRRKCRRAFRSRLAKADVMMVSHNPGVLRAFCDSGVVLEDGRLMVYDDIEDAIAAYGEAMLANQRRMRRRRDGRE